MKKMIQLPCLKWLDLAYMQKWKESVFSCVREVDMRFMGGGILEYLKKEAFGSYRLQARGAVAKIMFMYGEEQWQKVIWLIVYQRTISLIIKRSEDFRFTCILVSLILTVYMNLRFAYWWRHKFLEYCNKRLMIWDSP